ncbi:hypothetical protein [Streptomyces aureus]|uniref:hypothetical protein n=1 Tax=Streptomyces aureus TaxID=193461 RepID=UPI00362CAD3E
MRKERRHALPRRLAVPGLMEHLRTVLWGPAEFVGVPESLLAEGLLAGSTAAAAIVGAGFAGMWGGPPTLVTGEPGLVVAAALVLYLVILRAGRVLVGLVAVLGACLALTAPDVAAGVVLQQRGLVESARVASVETAADHGRIFAPSPTSTPFRQAPRCGAAVASRSHRGTPFRWCTTRGGGRRHAVSPRPGNCVRRSFGWPVSLLCSWPGAQSQWCARSG